MTKRSWTDLYMHGENLMTLCRSFKTQFQNAEERKDYGMMQIWGDALRRTTNDTIAVAKTVLAVEELVKGKRIVA